jgi:hypothetical protein
MANTIRIKRRNASGAAGAPSSLQQAELAFNEADSTLYVGIGTSGAGGSATTIEAIGGSGTFATKSYVTSAVAAVDVSSQLANYLTTANAASTYLTISNAGSTYLTISNASSTYAPLASPTLTGTPAAPTASAGTNTTQIATTAYVTSAISALVNGAGSALDTLKELADALGNDASFSATVTTSIGTKADRTLSNLTDASAARTNLGLGTMAVQAASNVAITGGTIAGIDLNGGTF